MRSMKDRIEAKIELLIDYIIHKPMDDVTLDDYTILASELRDIRFRECQTDNEKRMAELLSVALSPNCSCSMKK